MGKDDLESIQGTLQAARDRELAGSQAHNSEGRHRATFFVGPV